MKYRVNFGGFGLGKAGFLSAMFFIVRFFRTRDVQVSHSDCHS